MIIGVTMVHNEADIIGYTIRHLLYDEHVDHVIAADNLCTDDTRLILESFPSSRVTVLTDRDPCYNQDRKMSALAEMAVECGAEWVLPFDADEYWYAPQGIAAALRSCKADVVEARGWDHIPTANDKDSLSPFEAMPYRLREPQKLPKVAFRADSDIYIHHGNHNVNRTGERATDVLFYRHYQWRSLEQATHKIRHGNQGLEIAGLHWNYGTHWRTLATLDDTQLRGWWDDLRATPDLVYDPAP